MADNPPQTPAQPTSPPPAPPPANAPRLRHRQRTSTQNTAAQPAQPHTQPALQPNIRARAVAGAMSLGLVTAAVGGTYLLSENDTLFPFAVAACVATFSSVLLRFALFGLNATPGARVRHVHHHRHFTGERAAYVRTSQRLAMMDRDFTAADYDLLLDLDNNSQRFRRFLEGASMETVSRLPTIVYKDPPNSAAPSTAHAHMSHADDIAAIKAAAAVSAEVQHSLASTHHLSASDSEIAGATAKRCTICLEDFKEGMKIRILPCFHRFMAECIDPWLAQQARCPVCKFSIQEAINSLPQGMS